MVPVLHAGTPRRVSLRGYVANALRKEHTGSTIKTHGLV